VTYLLESLAKIAKEIEENQSFYLQRDRFNKNKEIDDKWGEIKGEENLMLTRKHKFHTSFCFNGEAENNTSNIRKAAEEAKRQESVRYLLVDEDIESQIRKGLLLVSAAVVTPYPPGFPILLPGQIVTSKIIGELMKMGNTEIHGYSKGEGLLVFSESGLERVKNNWKQEI